MKNNSEYLRLVLNADNEFRANASFSIQDVVETIPNDVKIKIDTGCPYTSIPIKRLGISSDKANELKQKDSELAKNGKVKTGISFGVNDFEIKKENDRSLWLAKEYMKLNSVTFVRKIENLEIDGCELGGYDVKVSYDRVGNILIGMDILKNWDIHIGKSMMPEETGETVFLACLYDKMNGDYFKELEKMFGTLTAASAAVPAER